jgi:NADH:ubiquinone oxidoreductase subunit K
MSQVLESPAAAPAMVANGFHNSLDPSVTEFGYRPVPMSVFVGTTLAILSIAALFAWMAIPLAIVALAVSLIGAVRVWRSQGEFAGGILATFAILLSGGMVAAGILLTVHRYRTEIPEGFQRISFARDISQRGVGMAEQEGQTRFFIPPEVDALVGKPIYLKGFIYPSGRPNYLTQFVLCKDNDQCCFGGQPKLQDMIGVQLTGDQTTDYTSSLVGVAGRLRLNENYGGGSLEPIYLLDAEIVAPALTSL